MALAWRRGLSSYAQVCVSRTDEVLSCLWLPEQEPLELLLDSYNLGVVGGGRR